MPNTPLLDLPLIDPAQAQKHITHNTALLLLDACVQLSVLSRNVTTPPTAPNEGDRYLIGAQATGSFAGKDLQVALWQNGMWVFLPPKIGWQCYVQGENICIIYTSQGWTAPQSNSGGSGSSGPTPVNADWNATSGLAQILNKPNIPDTQVNADWNANSGISQILNKPQLTNVAISGSYNDLSDKPPLPPVQANADWNATSGVSQILNKPNLTSASDLASFRNRLLNGNFAINQRAVLASGTLAANIYGLDRWKAGAGGCAYTLNASGIDTIVTLTSGSLVQVIAGNNIEGGNYVLSWVGNIQARVNGGAYGNSPMQLSNVPAGVNVTIEFGNKAGGTLSMAQFEPGISATPFERRPFTYELSLCRVYFESSYISGAAPGTPNALGSVGISYFATLLRGATAFAPITFFETKRATPLMKIYSSSGVGGAANKDGIDTPFSISANTHRIIGLVNQGLLGLSAGFNLLFHYTAEAEL